MLGACRTERAAVGPEGDLTLLDMARPPTSGTLPQGWRAEGSATDLQEGLGVVNIGGFPVLRAANGRESFAAVRPTAAILLASPYLTWTWNVEPHGPEGHAVSLVVGFRGGGGRSLLAGGLPDHDRLLVLAWGGSALQRGSLQVRGREGSARYLVRGGREQADTWHQETVDLSDLYARAWPGDDRGAVTVAFVGVAAAGGRTPGALYLSRISLTR